MGVPLVVIALFFAVFATLEWRRLPLVARVHVAVATAFAIGAMLHPGMTVGDAVEQGGDGIAYLLALARMAGLTALLVSVTAFLRQLPLGR